ncbi:MAG TPA: efflux RND transporter periplasmic adaptor subunit [Planktothrix sp.]
MKAPISGDGTHSEINASAHGGGSKKSTVKIALMLVLIAAVSAGGFFLFNMPTQEKQGAGKGSKKGDRPVPVTVATATIKDVPIEVRSIGNVLPFSVVNVVPQVGGQLTKVTFTQGQFVHKGDLLFQIDPRVYDATFAQANGNVAKDKAAVESARANMAKDQAQVGLLKANVSKDTASQKYAEAEYKRYMSLVAQGAVSKEQADQMSTNADTAKAAVDADNKAVENARDVVKADKAAIDTALATVQADQAAATNTQIQVEFTKIYSPIDGRTSSLNVYQGNIVQANQTTALVTIDQVKPIYIQFTLPEQNLDQIRRSIEEKTLKVDAMIEGQKTDLVKGGVSFIQNTVDTTSGTVTLRATFDNAQHRLYPGQFVDVIVTMPSNGSTVVVPATALQTSQQGNSVYVVRNGQVDFVPVEVARTFGDMAAITKGIQAGDTVVTDGQLQLTPGARVSIQKTMSQPPDANAGAPPSAGGDSGN